MIQELTALIVVVLVGLYLWRADFAHYSITTIGVYKRLHRYQTDSGECTELHCDSTIDQGELRVATKEIVLFGCPTLRYGTVQNAYCEDHASFEYKQGHFDVQSTQRVQETLVAGIVGFAEWTVDPPEDTAFQDVPQTMSNTLYLMGVGFIVLMAALILYPIQKYTESMV